MKGYDSLGEAMEYVAKDMREAMPRNDWQALAGKIRVRFPSATTDRKELAALRSFAMAERCGPDWARNWGSRMREQVRVAAASAQGTNEVMVTASEG